MSTTTRCRWLWFGLCLASALGAPLALAQSSPAHSPPGERAEAQRPEAQRPEDGGSPKPLVQLKSEREPEADERVDDARAWAVGVSPEKQALAKQLFAEGTEFLLRSLEEQAILKYDQALSHWNHPGIHYNYAVALSTRDRAIETRHHLLEALRYGDQGPLDKLEVEQARRYLTLVEASLALVDIRTSQQEVTVSLNGQVLFTGPGRHHEFVEPDEYLVTATKPGWIPHERRVAFLPGKVNRVDLRLYSEQELTRYKRRWPMWGPVTVTTAGALVAGAGGVMLWQANRQFERYDAAVLEACPTGCSPNAPAYAAVIDRRDRAETWDILGTTALLAGGVTFVAGVGLMYLNREVSYRITPEEANGTAPELTVVPVAARGMGGLAAFGKF